MEYCKTNGIVLGKRYIVCLLLFFTTHSFLCMSQGIKVVRVEETNSGTDAFHAPNGKNGMPCGLVKIKSTIANLNFRGQIVGNVDNKTNEYYVYMEKGSTQLIVSRPNVLPVVVHFPDFGIESITSKATYSVEIKEVKLNPHKNTVTIDIKPRFASVFIDDLPIDINDNGHYQIIMPKGSHFCRFEAVGYSSYVQGLIIGKENPYLSVELESQLSDLDISCQTPLTSIYINDSLIGREAWRGKLPSGIYQIDVRKDGYVSYSQSISLLPKESQSINVPKLIRKKGKVMIETRPIKFHKAFIDGFEIKKFPVDIEVGKHSLILQAYGCDEIKENIEVVEDQENPFTFRFSFTQPYYEKAYQGDLVMMMALADNKLWSSKNEEDIQEGRFWLSKILSIKDQLNASFLSGIFIYDSYSVYTYDQLMEIAKSLDITYIGYPNYKVLFNLFTSSHVEDYAGAMAIIDACGSLEKEFDGGFCYWIGEACMKINRKNDAVKWFTRCINEYNGGGNVKEKAQEAIAKLRQTQF